MVNTIPLYNWIWAVEMKHFVIKYQLEALYVHDLYMAKPTFLVNLKYHLPVTLDLRENYPAAVKGYPWANSFPRKILVRLLFYDIKYVSNRLWRF